ncbi:hypothetical protein MAR_024812 [Mya arenaria]|uniref:Uncharacterized protein n=1 Tax=Mya arenaria TaxID=6604 RepID=A0ABY7DRV5_MYAAR|nr:hypothetical protein MAR_024812 [Mya arenaria]
MTRAGWCRFPRDTTTGHPHTHQHLQADIIPVQLSPLLSRANPRSHVQVKLPWVFLHWPLVQIPGISRHSLMSARKSGQGSHSWLQARPTEQQQ